MKRTLSSSVLALLLLATAAVIMSAAPPSGAQRKQPGKTKPAAGKGKAATKTRAKPADENALKAELDELVKLDAATHVERLKAFVKANPDTPQTLRAQEILTSARAALGDERLRGGDRAAGAELFREAVAEAPTGMSDKLF